MPTPAQLAEIAADLAALHEKPHAEWLPVLPPGAKGLVAGYEVRPHVQRFHDAVKKRLGVKNIGTYPTHSPALDRALDIHHAIGDDDLADAICDFSIDNLEEFGGRYIISRQQIWHRLDPVWRWMEDRGSPTQNHLDHVHWAAEETAPDPKPEPIPQGDPHMLTFRYIFDGVDWVFDGPSRLFFQCDNVVQITEVLDKLKIPALGTVSAATHRRYSALAHAAGYKG